MLKNPDSLRKLSRRCVYKSVRNYTDHESIRDSNKHFMRNHLKLLTLDEIENIRRQLQDRNIRYNTLLNDANYQGGDVIQHLLDNPHYGVYYGALYKSVDLFEMAKEILESRGIDVPTLTLHYGNALIFSIMSGDVKMFQVCYKAVASLSSHTGYRFNMAETLNINCPKAALWTHMQLLSYFVRYRYVNVELMILRGAALNKESTKPFEYLIQVLKRDHTDEHVIDVLNDILRGSDTVSEDVMKLVIRHGANDYNAGLMHCTRMNDNTLVLRTAEHFIIMGATNLIPSLISAARHLNFHVFMSLFRKESSHPSLQQFSNEAMEAVITHNAKQTDTLSNNDFIANKLRTVLSYLIIVGRADVNEGMRIAIETFDVNMVNVILNLGLSDLDMNKAIERVAQTSHIRVWQMLLESGYEYDHDEAIRLLHNELIITNEYIDMLQCTKKYVVVDRVLNESGSTTAETIHNLLQHIIYKNDVLTEIIRLRDLEGAVEYFY